MTKKHLISCSGILTLLVLAKLFIFGTPASDAGLNEPIHSLTENTVANDVPETADEYVALLNFADETVPAQDPQVVEKLKKTLKANKYENRRSNVLHERATKYFPIIEPILRKHGIPDDFKFLTVVESELKSTALSPVGARGYWQFMPATAKGYGLKIGKGVDERTNIIKSTEAAARHILNLYKQFNNWTLVAAAYNVGEGHIKRQIEKQGTSDYYKMKLNKETASYVYKIISMKEIMQNPLRYGYSTDASRKIAEKEATRLANQINPLRERKAMLALQMLIN